MSDRPRKTHRLRNFVIFPLVGLFGLLVIVAIATSGGEQPAPTTPDAATPVPTTSPGQEPPPPPAPQPSESEEPATVVLFGTGEATYTVMTDSTVSNTVTLPHTEQLPDGHVTVSVTRSPSMESYMETGQPDRGQVGCRILRDGKVVEEHSAEGEFVSVTCSKWY